MTITTAMAMILQADLERRGAKLSLGDCEAALARVLDSTRELGRRIAVQAVEMPLCPPPGTEV
ncbi:hypothetical protein JQ594_15310 [Bradyrhizobium manausense]|uniref:hypothetical protein n=1 Tax=Bradyrhizobium manausense TaxID=989370 RepID=UPI001BAA5265|nr:hypothetical protein [Bradyrhizobium manausense]MBR0687298.1 hypothetical protein [Bradyrhizobium manausense]